MPVRFSPASKRNTPGAGSLTAVGSQIILGNTYHLHFRPGDEVIAGLGGLHAFSGWDGPILTDSGGFQVMSLSGISKLTEEAVTFSSHIDGSKHVLTPERSIEIQADLLGSDIVMQLDECVAWPAEEARARSGMELSARWAKRSKAAFGTRDAQALFGIQQGSTFENLRRESSDRLREIGFDGYAIGGLAVGEGHQAMCEVLDYAPDMLPADRPRYLMGVGRPIDIIEAVLRGIDMFDCVMPTRNGRNAMLFTTKGVINIDNKKWEKDFSPLDDGLDCEFSHYYSKAYLKHLFKAGEILALTIASIQNLAFYLWLVKQARKHIIEGDFASWKNDIIPVLKQRL